MKFDEAALFEFDKADLKAEGKEQLKAYNEKARADLSSAEKVRVVGYTDNTGTAEHNSQLSKQRAEAVRDYLVSIGADPKKLDAIGAADANPIADNSTKEGQAKNRRVEIEVTGLGKVTMPAAVRLHRDTGQQNGTGGSRAGVVGRELGGGRVVRRPGVPRVQRKLAQRACEQLGTVGEIDLLRRERARCVVVDRPVVKRAKKVGGVGPRASSAMVHPWGDVEAHEGIRRSRAHRVSSRCCSTRQSSWR